MKIKHILTQIRDYFDEDKQRKIAEEAFLSEATDIVDLERRLRILENTKRGVML
jgi:phage regulator Rha-like protein